MSSKPITVWCVVGPDGKIRDRHFGLTRKNALYWFGMHWDLYVAHGYTVRKFHLVPVETKARGK